MEYFFSALLMILDRMYRYASLFMLVKFKICIVLLAMQLAARRYTDCGSSAHIRMLGYQYLKGFQHLSSLQCRQMYSSRHSQTRIHMQL